MGFENVFSFPGSGMLIGKGIDGPVKQNTLAHLLRIQVYLFSFYKIAEKVSCQYSRLIKR
jgi:hypothetical protein